MTRISISTSAFLCVYVCVWLALLLPASTVLGWSVPYYSSPFSFLPHPHHNDYNYFIHKRQKGSKNVGDFLSSTSTTSTRNTAPCKQLWMSSSDEEESASVSSDEFSSLQSSLPYLDQWQIMSDGSVAGTISNHPSFEDGSRIDTSVVANPEHSYEMFDQTVITTVTGSQYLLGQRLPITLEDWEWTGSQSLQGYAYGYLDTSTIPEGEFITTSPVLERTSQTMNDSDDDATHRFVQGTVVTTASGSQYKLGQPVVMSYPRLEQWKRLEGGSIAGIVSRHSMIPDGELITTSPLVEYDESHGIVVVTTASGSHYQLGEPESVRLVLQEEEEEEEDNQGGLEGDTEEEEEKDEPETIVAEEEEEEIQSINIPKAPDMAPPSHVFLEDKQIDDEDEVEPLDAHQNNHVQPPQPPKDMPPPPLLELLEQDFSSKEGATSTGTETAHSPVPHFLSSHSMKVNANDDEKDNNNHDSDTANKEEEELFVSANASSMGGNRTSFMNISVAA